MPTGSPSSGKERGWDVSWCKTCNEYIYDRHICPPKWKLWVPEAGDTEEDAREVYATSPEAAAEKWAEEDDRNSADYSIVNGNEATVHLRYDDKPERAELLGLETTELVLVVSGESVPSYTANRRRERATTVGGATHREKGK